MLELGDSRRPRICHIIIIFVLIIVLALIISFNCIVVLVFSTQLLVDPCLVVINRTN